jgi:predicted  nucleic acid-binding Zn-ribbon protein
LEHEVSDLNERAQQLEDKVQETVNQKKAAEKQCDELKRNVADLEMSIRKAEAEKQSKDHNLRAMQVGAGLEHKHRVCRTK